MYDDNFNYLWSRMVLMYQICSIFSIYLFYFILCYFIQCQCQCQSNVTNVNQCQSMSISIERIHIYHLLLIMWMLSLCLKLILMFRFFCLLSIRYIEPAFPNVFFSLSTSSRILFLISVYFIALPPLLPL